MKPKVYRRRSIGTLLAAGLALGACEQAAAPPQGAVAATPAAMPRTIDVFDLLQGKRSVTPDWQAINAQPFGSRGNPVRAFMPDGEYRYLARLNCADGSRPTYGRVGNFGLGPYTTIIDGFEVKCPSSTTMIFMDMYHQGHVEARAVPGFTIQPGP